MQRYTDEILKDACYVQWHAGDAAGLHCSNCAKADSLVLPPRFTAWLLMARAGVPVDVIAYVSHVEPRQVTRGAFVAWAMARVWPPYARRLEDMLQRVPRYAASRERPAWRSKGALCVVHG